MSLCEISLDFNAADVAFSKSGKKIAVLTSDGVSLYSWELKTASSLNLRLENAFPFSQSSERGRQIAFLGETDVYVLKQRDFSQGEIERIDVPSGEKVPVFEPTGMERISYLFSNLGQDALWIAQGTRQKKGLSYSVLSTDSSGFPSVTPWVESPGQETSWALATQLSNGSVGFFKFSCCSMLTSISTYYSPSLDRALSMPTRDRWRRIALHSLSLPLILSSQQVSTC